MVHTHFRLFVVSKQHWLSIAGDYRCNKLSSWQKLPATKCLLIKKQTKLLAINQNNRQFVVCRGHKLSVLNIPGDNKMSLISYLQATKSLFFISIIVNLGNSAFSQTICGQQQHKFSHWNNISSIYPFVLIDFTLIDQTRLLQQIVCSLINHQWQQKVWILLLIDYKKSCLRRIFL